MASPTPVTIQASQIDSFYLPESFSTPYKLYVLNQATDLTATANQANSAADSAYEANQTNIAQQVEIDKNTADIQVVGARIDSVETELTDHETRITNNTVAIAGKASNGANSDITSLNGLTTPLSIAQGGTGATTADAARTSLGLGTAAVASVGTGDDQLPDMNSFSSLKAIPGWQKLPSGLIIQWGQTTPGASGDFNVNLPIAFTTGVGSLSLTVYDDTTGGALVWRRTPPNPLTNIQFGVSGATAYTSISWIVIGW